MVNRDMHHSAYRVQKDDRYGGNNRDKAVPVHSGSSYLLSCLSCTQLST